MLRQLRNIGFVLVVTSLWASQSFAGWGSFTPFIEHGDSSVTGVYNTGGRQYRGELTIQRPCMVFEQGQCWLWGFRSNVYNSSSRGSRTDFLVLINDDTLSGIWPFVSASFDNLPRGDSRSTSSRPVSGYNAAMRVGIK